MKTIKYKLIGINFALSVILLISGIESGLFGVIVLAGYAFISLAIYKRHKRKVNEQINLFNEWLIKLIEK